MLRKWKSSEPAVLAQIPHELVECHSTQAVDVDHLAKVLGMEWSTTLDTFQPMGLHWDPTVSRELNLLVQRGY